MYGVFIVIIGLLSIGISKGAMDLTSGREGPSRSAQMGSREEAIAESIAAAIQWSLADVAAACEMQPAANTPAACSAGATAGPLVTDVTGAATGLPIYSAGSPYGVVRTYYVPSGRAAYLVAAWLPASGPMADRYCTSVLRDLQRLTGNSRWVTPYQVSTGAAYIYNSDTSATALATQAVFIGAPARALTDGCPVMIEPLDH